MAPFPNPTLIDVSRPGQPEPIHLAVREIAPEAREPRAAVVFCHGFPDIAHGWRNQLQVVADAGFRAIAPDQRGTGARPDGARRA